MFINVTFRLFSVSFFFFFPQLQGMCNLSSQHRDGTHVPCAGSAESSPLDLQGSPLLVLDWNSTLTNHDLLHGEKWRCQESLSHIFTSRSLESPLPCRLTFWLKTVKCYPDLFSESCSFLSFSSSWDLVYQRLLYFSLWVVKGMIFMNEWKKWKSWSYLDKDLWSFYLTNFMNFVSFVFRTHSLLHVYFSLPRMCFWFIST